MKFRTGFVSNSSSSSFTCLVCGSEQSGYDLCLTDAEMHSCVNDHYFCDHHLIGEKSSTDDRYDCPSSRCPICQLQAISDADLIQYLLNGRKNEEVAEEIRSKFKTYQDFVRTWKPNYVAE